MSTSEPREPVEPGEPIGPADSSEPSEPSSHRESEESTEQAEPVSEETLFAEIVANYGEQPVIPEPTPTPEPAAVSEVLDPDDWDDFMLPGEFVPPEPDPIQWHGARSVAWIAVLGCPALAVLWTILSRGSGWSAPSWLAYLLIGGFLGGFGYLVVTMPKDRDDPWDDGARV